ncbi:hypothetical protein JB92DRAFT_2831057 [Gautieria morchelliformis]|nr:hypothetical protein JB92DRAFT_2831057 [Gautieria morchelliformis]
MADTGYCTLHCAAWCVGVGTADDAGGPDQRDGTAEVLMLDETSIVIQNIPRHGSENPEEIRTKTTMGSKKNQKKKFKVDSKPTRVKRSSADWADSEGQDNRVQDIAPIEQDIPESKPGFGTSIRRSTRMRPISAKQAVNLQHCVLILAHEACDWMVIYQSVSSVVVTAHGICAYNQSCVLISILSITLYEPHELLLRTQPRQPDFLQYVPQYGYHDPMQMIELAMPFLKKKIAPRKIT